MASALFLAQAVPRSLHVRASFRHPRPACIAPKQLQRRVAPRRGGGISGAAADGQEDPRVQWVQQSEQQQEQHDERQQGTRPPPPPPAASGPPPAAASAADAPPAAHQHRHRRHLPLIVTLLVVVSSAIVNRLLYKAATVPLGNYIFFLAQLQTFAYLLVYYAVLGLRWRAGRVSAAMLRVPLQRWRLFLAIGFVEAVASLLGFLGAANLPGVVLPLLAQSILAWQVLLAVLVLKKHLSAAQYFGTALVLCGVCMAAWPSSGSPLTGISPFYAGIFTFSMLFPALDTILKEKVFREAKAALKADLDIFVVNSMGSLAQGLFVFLLLPITTSLRGMSVQQLPAYLAQGWQCFRGLTPACGSECSGAPLLPLAYVAVNLLFNVAALELIRQAGNVAMSLTMSAIVPLTIYCFTIPLPFLPPSPPLAPLFGLGTMLLLSGLLLFNAPLWIPTFLRVVRSWAAEGDGSGGGPPRLAVAPK